MEKTAKKETIVYGSFLETRIVKVKPVESSGKWANLLVAGQNMGKEAFLFDKIKRSFQVPLNSAAKGGGVVFILDNERRKHIEKYTKSFPGGMTQQEFFEKELGIDLNPTLKREENFWRTDKRGRVTLTKEGMTLNLSNSIHMLRYLILMSDTMHIAKSYDERKNSQSFEFMIINESKVTSKKVEAAKLNARAQSKYLELTRSDTEMVGFIKSLGRVVATNLNKEKFTEWLESEVLNELEKSPERFLQTLNDPLYKARIFVQEAVNAGALKKMSNKRFTTDGGVELGDLMSTISWLEDDDNQAAKIKIKSQIEMSKKK